MSISLHKQNSKQGADRTCFSLARFDIDYNSVALLSEMFKQDHVVLLVGIVNKNRLGAHTKYLKETQDEMKEQGRRSTSSDLPRMKPVKRTWGKPTSTNRVKRLVRFKVCGSWLMQWSEKAAMTGLHSGHAFSRCKMSATVLAQSRPIRLPNREKETDKLTVKILSVSGIQKKRKRKTILQQLHS